MNAAVKYEPYWWETAPAVPGPPLTADVRCDVAIVGAGFTGLWTAHQLKLARPELDVQVIEAEHAGAGASGHADGFITPTIGHSLSALIGRFGADQAKVAYSVAARSILEIGRFCRKYGVDAELDPNGYLQVASTPEQLRWLERDIELADRLGAAGSVKLMDREEARSRIDSPAIHGAIKSTRAGWSAVSSGWSANRACPCTNRPGRCPSSAPPPATSSRRRTAGSPRRSWSWAPTRTSISSSGSGTRSSRSGATRW
jgi:hypothetical protein